MQYSISNERKKKLMVMAIVQTFIGASITLIGIFPLGMVWWTRIIVSGVGAIITMQGYYDIRYFVGTEKEGLSIDKETQTISYFDEFKGSNSIFLPEIESIKIFLKNKEIYMLELKKLPTNNTKKKSQEENINVSGLNPLDVEDLIEIIKEIAPKIPITNSY